jgi:hypothetical protein
MEQEQSGRKGKANPGDSNKWKMVPFHEPILKKPHKDVKHCSLCKNHGGVHATHNMSDCHKYDKNCKLKKGFQEEPAW